jgi:hypothetical protein
MTGAYRRNARASGPSCEVSSGKPAGDSADHAVDSVPGDYTSDAGYATSDKRIKRVVNIIVAVFATAIIVPDRAFAFRYVRCAARHASTELNGARYGKRCERATGFHVK